MNIRKPSDYSSLYSALDVLMGSDLAEMELYCEIGRAVCGRTEKGAAVMAAEYLQSRYPERKGFSPRNLRRMRLFYLTYGNTPDRLEKALKLAWTQNVTILEACEAAGVVSQSRTGVWLGQDRIAQTDPEWRVGASLARRTGGYLLY